MLWWWHFLVFLRLDQRLFCCSFSLLACFWGRVVYANLCFRVDRVTLLGYYLVSGFTCVVHIMHWRSSMFHGVYILDGAVVLITLILFVFRLLTFIRKVIRLLICYLKMLFSFWKWLGFLISSFEWSFRDSSFRFIFWVYCLACIFSLWLFGHCSVYLYWFASTFFPFWGFSHWSFLLKEFY